MSYVKRYCGGRQKEIFIRGDSKKDGTHKKKIWDCNGSSNLGELNDRLRSTIMIRRLKSEVLTELPEKTIRIIRFECGDSLESVTDQISQCNEVLALDEYASPDRDELDFINKRMHIGEMARLRKQVAMEKLPACIEYISDLYPENDDFCCVVMAWHRDVIAELKNEFRKLNPAVITGNTPIPAREEAIQDFQSGHSRIFLGNINAAGVGITLTRASQMVFCEMDYVPANMNQAIDRCHRIGQENAVTVDYLVFDGSLDDRLCQILKRKQKIIDQAIN